MINKYIEYAKAFGARDEVINWINVVLKASLDKKKNISGEQIEHILDYLCSDKSPKRLMKMSIAQAKSNTDKWVKANQKKGKHLVDRGDDIETIHNYKDGSCIVKLLSTKAYRREGFMMNHCLGGYSPNDNRIIYSYRDNKNNPHATFEVVKDNNEIMQIKGKGNGPIHPKYIMPILDFLTSIGQTPRPSEMKNLGYYHINNDVKDFVIQIKGWEKQVTTIHGELYAFAKR